MTRSVQLFAVPHPIQGRKFQGYVEDPSFSSWIKRVIQDGFDFVFEEAAGLSPSIAEELALSILGPGHYIDIDPPPTERHKYGLAEKSGSGGSIDPLDRIHYMNIWESMDAREQMKREELWQERIQSQNFEKGLVICGLAHCLSLAFRLQTAGVCVEAFTYIPHTRLCKRPHAD